MKKQKKLLKKGSRFLKLLKLPPAFIFKPLVATFAY